MIQINDNDLRMKKALNNVLVYLRNWLTNDKNIKIIKEVNDAIWGGANDHDRREDYNRN